MASDSSSSSDNFPNKTSETTSPPAVNKFSNDGSFLEIFKRKMEEEKRKKEALESGVTDEDSSNGTKSMTLSQSDTGTSSESSASKKPGFYSFVGKRRGGAPVLKTGAVKKQKKEETKDDSGEKKDAWSRYLDEVQKYKSQSCQDEDKTRPLVK